MIIPLETISNNFIQVHNQLSFDLYPVLIPEQVEMETIQNLAEIAYEYGFKGDNALEQKTNGINAIRVLTMFITTLKKII